MWVNAYSTEKNGLEARYIQKEESKVSRRNLSFYSR